MTRAIPRRIFSDHDVVELYMTGKTSQTRNAKQLNDFSIEASPEITSKLRPAELISSVIPQDQDRLTELVRNRPMPDTCMYQGRIVELFDSEENELYTR